jgi:hypothetical protein
MTVEGETLKFVQRKMILGRIDFMQLKEVEDIGCVVPKKY